MTEVAPSVSLFPAAKRFSTPEKIFFGFVIFRYKSSIDWINYQWESVLPTDPITSKDPLNE
jgi:hypothetical protein